ncbi:MAG: hypothetical protein IKK33_16120, partial [Lachnospiraceae bacterium]|nr:hypothetical protein [Lachnospiraceae bacterium]
RVIDKLKSAVTSAGNKFKSSKLYPNNIGAVDTRIFNPSKWDDMVLDGGVLKTGGSTNVSKKARLLQEGGNGTIVEVKSFSEADNLLKEAFPDYQKVKGIGAQDANGIRKKNKLDRFKQGGAYHKDYAVNKKTGRIYGHAEGNPHGQYPHINIKRTDGKNVMINIIRGNKQ